MMPDGGAPFHRLLVHLLRRLLLSRATPMCLADVPCARSDAVELKQVMEQLGSPIDEKGVQDIISSLDIDQNGQVEWSEFASLMADRWIRQDGATDLTMAAQLFEGVGDDGERKGEMDLSELRQALCSLGEYPMSDADFEALVRLGDPQGTGRMSVEAFLALPCWEAPSVTSGDMRSPRRREAEG